MQNFDVIVIGGGAAGLACAVSLKKQDASLGVCVLEGGERLGRKLSSTGNGQGNLSNADLSAGHYHGSLAPLAAKLLDSGEYDPLSLFDCLFTTAQNGRVYPAGKQASALTDSLIFAAKKSGVILMTEARVISVKKGFTVELADGRVFGARAVVMAFGGKAQKQFGTDGQSYALATSLGHSVTPLYPCIVQLKCGTRHIKNLKGIRAECNVTALSSNGEKLCSCNGDVIFTDYGVSGNAVFYISSYLAEVEGGSLSLEFLPGISAEEIENNVRLKMREGYPETELLNGTLHNQLGRAIMRRCAGADAAEIAKTVKNFTLPVLGSLGFDYAQVTRGGIPASEVGEDLQSKIVRGLFFAGEALDVDGDCGGYNLTFAFVSGMHAAKCVAGALNCYD